MTQTVRANQNHRTVQFLLHQIGYKCFFFSNEVMLNKAHDSWCDDEHQ